MVTGILTGDIQVILIYKCNKVSASDALSYRPGFSLISVTGLKKSDSLIVIPECYLKVVSEQDIYVSQQVRRKICGFSVAESVESHLPVNGGVS